MDLTQDLSYEELKRIYSNYFSLNWMGKDINNKFALISLVCYLTYKLSSKKPDVSPWSILYKVNNAGNPIVNDTILKGLSVVCSDFLYGCTEFPTFGIEDKQIPNKIRELLKNYIPF